jgi:hypothetical protein
MGGDAVSTNIMRIIGSAAVIEIGDDILTTAGSSNTWHFAPDAGGISTINVTDDIDFSGTMEIDFENFDLYTSSLVLIDYNGNRTGTFAATNILTAGWSADIEYDDTADQVKLINIKGPPKGTIMVVR